MEAQTIELVAWFVLRAVFAWMFLYPAVGLVRDFGGAVETTALAFPFAPRFFAAGGIAVMVLGGLMILVGFYGAWAGLALVAFNLGGAVIHYRLAASVSAVQASASASEADRDAIARLQTLGTIGHVTSAEKNFVLTAVAFFFALMGTGPGSLGPAAGLFVG